MQFNEYQEEAIRTAVYPRAISGIYPVLGLCGETGEVAEFVKKLHRDHGGMLNDELAEKLKKELGDVLWYLSAISREYGFTLDDIATGNLRKLEERRVKGTIHGTGSDR